MALQSVETMWTEFAEKVFAGINPSKVQREEMRRAFYAGVWSVIMTLEQIGSSKFNQRECVDHLSSIGRECLDFKNRLLSDHAQGQ